MVKRSEPRVYGLGFLSREGVTEDGLTVFLLRGLGYFVCPPFLHISYHHGIITLCYASPLRGRVRRSAKEGDTEKLKAVLTDIVEVIHKEGFLFNSRVRRDWFMKDNVSVKSSRYHEGRRKNVEVRLPNALGKLLGKKAKTKHVATIDIDDPTISERRIREMAGEKANQLRKTFRDRCTVTPDEVLVFHQGNPLASQENTA